MLINFIYYLILSQISQQAKRNAFVGAAQNYFSGLETIPYLFNMFAPRLAPKRFL